MSKAKQRRLSARQRRIESDPKYKPRTLTPERRAAALAALNKALALDGQAPVDDKGNPVATPTYSGAHLPDLAPFVGLSGTLR